MQNLFFQINEKSLTLVLYYYILNHDSTLSKKRTSRTSLKLKEVQSRPYYQKNRNTQIQSLKKYINLSELLTLPEIKKNVFKENYSNLKFSNGVRVVREYKKFYSKMFKNFVLSLFQIYFICCLLISFSLLSV